MVDGGLVAGSVLGLTSYPGGSSGPVASTSPAVVEFELDTVLGAIDIDFKDTVSNIIRLAVDGAYATLTSTFRAPANTGNTVKGLITGLSAGSHIIRLEVSAGATFCGVTVGPTDVVRALPKPQLVGYVVGDSFTEPTVQDTTANAMPWGWVQTLAQITGLEIRSSGSGGTGYLNPGSGGRVKFRDRLQADVLAQSPDFILWAGGLNDAAYTTAQIQAEASACFVAAAAALPNVKQIVLSPFNPKGAQYISGPQFAIRDAIQAAAVAAGLPFVDVLSVPVDQRAQTPGTLTAASLAAATTIVSSALVGTTYGSNPYISIGSGATREVRIALGTSGTGPWTIAVDPPLTYPHGIGEVVTKAGPAIVTGNGNQGAPNGSGTADRLTGNDSTHPTQVGHRELGRLVARVLGLTLPS
jgi:lysophospholipase L1-like esterase